MNNGVSERATKQAKVNTETVGMTVLGKEPHAASPADAVEADCCYANIASMTVLGKEKHAAVPADTVEGGCCCGWSRHGA